MAAATLLSLLPAIKATGSHVQARVASVGGGGRSTLQFGRVWTTAMIVNEAFARRVGGGMSAVGRRVRYVLDDTGTADPWLEIVGVVEDVGMTPTDRGEAPYIFHAVAPDAASPAFMAIRMSGDPTTLAPRVRAIAAELDPRLRVAQVGSLEDCGIL